MSDFLFIYRMDTSAPQPSPEQMQSRTKSWMDWIGSLAAQDKLVSSGNRLMPEGKVTKPNNVVTNGPYVETKEAIGGYSIVKADTLAEAVELSKGCPIIVGGGGSVEVRQIWPMD